MKFLVTIAVVAILGVGGYMLIKPDSGSSSSGNESAQVANALTYSSVKQQLIDGAKLIDVRTAEEYAGGHIEDSELLPLADIQSGTLPASSKDATLYVYCRSGNRSAQAKQLLEQAGYTKVVDLGAITDVASIGGKIIQ